MLGCKWIAELPCSLSIAGRGNVLWFSHLLLSSLAWTLAVTSSLYIAQQWLIPQHYLPCEKGNAKLFDKSLSFGILKCPSHVANKIQEAGWARKEICPQIWQASRLESWALENCPFMSALTPPIWSFCRCLLPGCSLLDTVALPHVQRYLYWTLSTFL